MLVIFENIVAHEKHPKRAGTRLTGFLSFGLAFGISLFIRGTSASALPANAVNTIYDSYAKAFIQVQGTNAWFKEKQSGGRADFWKHAEEIATVLDAYEWTGKKAYKPMLIQLLNGFVHTNGALWTSNPYNDDCMWAAIDYARGYLDTGDKNFRAIAKANFDMVYARAWDDHLGGGLWWKTNNTTKNACVNGPGAIAAYLLFKSLGDVTYRDKALSIYVWERANLFDTNTGKIFDSERANGRVRGSPTTYNQGTFVGAANYLGFTNDAMLAVDYTISNMTTDGILPQYGATGNNSGFNAIFLRWMVRFTKDRKLQGKYQSWLDQNAEAAWKVRRPSDNLSWCQWHDPTPAGTNLQSWGCISSVEAMLAAWPGK